MIRSITLPFNKEILADLRCGDRLLLSGKLYTARDAAHKRLFDMIRNNEPLPIDITNETIYYAGPCPAAPGRIIGSAGPTTSGRMDKYAPALINNGLLGMIGKGERDEAVIESMFEHGAVYFGATGGAGALLSTKILSTEIVAFSDLGTEAIRRIEIKDFPVIVLIDSHKGNLYTQNIAKYRK